MINVSNSHSLRTISFSSKINPIHFWFFSVFLLLTLMTGCSSVQVRSDLVNWNEISTIAVIEPDTDRWDLKQNIEEELLAMGYRVSDNPTTADLQLVYATGEGPDLGDDSEILMRLKSLHLYFENPNYHDRRAVIDYFYPTSGAIDPETGVTEALKTIKKSRDPEQSPPPIKAYQAQSRPDSDKKVTEPETASKENDAAEHQTSPISQEQTSSPTANEKIRSPWSLKLKSWGFENWGKEDETASDE